MELYKIIPENFFAILNCKNQDLYVRCLMAIFRAYEQGSVLGMDKTLALQAVETVLESQYVAARDLDIIETGAPVRDKANAVLRRLEECEWIDIDVNNDYVEILNFRDYSITIMDALKTISQDTMYGYGIGNPDPDFASEFHEFRGYIFTVYTLLQNETTEFGMVVQQVYKNTIAFIREIRKLDSRLKYYIRTIIENSEIKDLINLLVNYKVELVDQAYSRLKTSDNVNKYKLAIVKKLEEYQQNPVIMEMIAREYLPQANMNGDLAKVRANKRIDDIIDIYNSLGYIIDEIDKKNKIYVNSTIAKIKFLLNDDENVIGKLNAILRYTADNVKRYRTEPALKTIAPLFQLRTHGIINNSSLYSPRGTYVHGEGQFLLLNELTSNAQLQEAFYKEIETEFSEDVIRQFLQAFFRNQSIIRASELVSEDVSDEAVLRLLYILVYAGEEMNYYIQSLDTSIHHRKFRMSDFQIVRGQKLS